MCFKIQAQSQPLDTKTVVRHVKRDIVNDAQGIHETLSAKHLADKDDIINVADMTYGSILAAFAVETCSRTYLIRTFPTPFLTSQGNARCTLWH